MAKLSCICCDAFLENIMGDEGHQPNDGLSFHSYGHYGSTVFDPMDDTFIEIAVCDPCVKKAASKGQVLYVERVRREAFSREPFRAE